MLQLILESENEQTKNHSRISRKTQHSLPRCFFKKQTGSKKLFNSFNFHKSQQLSAGLKTSLK